MKATPKEEPQSIARIYQAYRALKKEDHPVGARHEILFSFVVHMQEGKRGPSTVELAEQALTQVVKIKHAGRREELMAAILDGPIKHMRNWPGGRAMIERAVSNGAEECLPLLHAAGFRLDNDPHSREMVAKAIGVGTWPYPDLLLPNLRNETEIGGIIEGAFRALGFERTDDILQTLERARAWIQEGPNPQITSDHLTRGLADWWKNEGSSEPSRWMVHGEAIAELLAALMKLGTRTEALEALLVDKPMEGVIRGVLARAEQRVLEEGTPLVARTGRGALRL